MHIHYITEIHLNDSLKTCYRYLKLLYEGSSDRGADEAIAFSYNDIFCLFSLLPIGESSSCPPSGKAVISFRRTLGAEKSFNKKVEMMIELNKSNCGCLIAQTRLETFGRQKQFRCTIWCPDKQNSANICLRCQYLVFRHFIFSFTDICILNKK